MSRFRETPTGLADGLGLGSVRQAGDGRCAPGKPLAFEDWVPRVLRVAQHFDALKLRLSAAVVKDGIHERECLWELVGADMCLYYCTSTI